MGYRKDYHYTDRDDHDERSPRDWHLEVEERAAGTRPVVSSRALLTFLVLVTICLSFIAGQSTAKRSSLNLVQEDNVQMYSHASASTALEKPEGLRVIGLVFCESLAQMGQLS